MCRAILSPAAVSLARTMYLCGSTPWVQDSAGGGGGCCCGVFLMSFSHFFFFFWWWCLPSPSGWSSSFFSVIGDLFCAAPSWHTGRFCLSLEMCIFFSFFLNLLFFSCVFLGILVIQQVAPEVGEVFECE